MGRLSVGHGPQTVPAAHPREFDNVPTETIVAWMGAAESGDISAREHLRHLRDRYSAMINQVRVSSTTILFCL